MAAAESQFVRGSPERVSRSRRGGSGGAGAAGGGGGAVIMDSSPVTNNALEIARQRAMQAAEYYHKNVLQGSDSNDEGHGPSPGVDSHDHRAGSPPLVELQSSAPTAEGDLTRVNGTMADRGIVAASDAYYKQKLRSGFIDLRNSYNEKIRPRNAGYSRTSGANAKYGPPRPAAGGPSLQDSAHVASHPEESPPGPGSDNPDGHLPGYAHYQRALAAERRGLYRSNSSLELEHVDYVEDEGAQPTAVHRDYGSASSLDLVGASSDSFFAMLQDYRNERSDQRAPAPPKMHEVLRGKLELGSQGRPGMPVRHEGMGPPYRSGPPPPIPARGEVQKVNEHESPKITSNGSVPIEDEPPSGGDGSQSPRMRNKSQKGKDRKQRSKTVAGGNDSSGSGLFKKFRSGKSELDSGSKSVDSAGIRHVDGEVKPEERQKRKAFTHFDCQSIGINLQDVIRRRTTDGGVDGVLKRRNTTTGASAASAVRNSFAGVGGGETTQDPSGSEEPDAGDGKSNDLVLSCPFFRNEIGGEEERGISLNRVTAQKRVQQLLGNKAKDTSSLVYPPACNGIAILDTSHSPHGVSEPSILSYKGLVFEYVDQGAFYYRNFFNGLDHQNFFGTDDNLGPLAISIRREKLDEKERETATGKAESGGHCYQYRIIVRTSELTTMRGSILEEVIPSSSRLSSTRGLPPKEVLEHVLPGLNLSCLRQASLGPKTPEQLLKLDEQGITKSYKIGVMYCRANQASEEEMYNNEHAGRAFEEFLNCVGQKVKLKGFEQYRGGLDAKTDSTGTHSLYTQLHNFEIMFHVSTMLPYTPNNRQQLLRKRHIGNDIVTLVFQEPGAQPFTPKTVRSHFQHVFIMVKVHSPNTDHTKYSIGVSQSKDVPPFGPPIPEGMLFNKSQEFVEFLLTKAINAENAVHRSDKFTAMAMRTRQEYLKDLATNFVTTTPIDSGSKLSKFSLGSGRRKEKPKIRSTPDIFARAAVVWSVQVEDMSQQATVACYLAIAGESLALIDRLSKHVLLTTTCKSVIGWTLQDNSVRLYYNTGECVAFKTQSLGTDETLEIGHRLSMVTPGCETMEMTLHRNGMGQLGFHVHQEGIIWEVEHHSLAWKVGLRPGCRLVEICKVAMATLTHDQMIDLLRTSVTVKVVVIQPHDDGSPRRGCDEALRLTHAPLGLHLSPSTEHPPPGEEDLHGPPREAPLPRDAPLPRLPGSGSSIGMQGLGGDRYADRSHRYTDYNNRATSGVNNEAAHSKQASHDSAGSRSSGRSSEGQGSSERHGSKADLMASETADHGRQNKAGLAAPPVPPHGNGPDGTSPWKVKIYPAYQSPPGASTRVEAGPQQWLEEGLTPRAPDHHGDSGYHSNASQFASHQPLNTAYPNSHKAAAAANLQSLPGGGGGGGAPYNYGHYPDKHDGGGAAYHSAHPGAGLLGIPSMTNLSQHSDLSSHSSGSHGGQPLPPAGALPHRARFDPTNRDNAAKLEVISPMGRQRQAAFVSNRRSIMEVSPQGSNSSSPRSSSSKAYTQARVKPKRSLHLSFWNLAGVASSEENLARLRPAVGLAGSGAATSKTSPGSASTFQEDLMRLIDPDVSFSGSNHTPEKLSEECRSHGSGGSSGGRENAAGRRPRSSPRLLHRALSDESICGAVNPRQGAHGHHHHHHRRTVGMDRLASDVVFSSEHPARATRPPARLDDEFSPEQRLSPRATQDYPGTLLRVRTTTAAAAAAAAASNAPKTTSSPSMPLPDDGTGMEWSNLLDAARAFESTGNELNTKSVSMGELQKSAASSSSSSSTAAAAAAAAAAGALEPRNASASSRDLGIKSSKSSDMKALHSSRSQPNFSDRSREIEWERERERDTGEQDRERDRDRDRDRDQAKDKDRGRPERPPLPTARLHHPPWRSTGESGASPRVQELEVRVAELEREVQREQRERDALEAEVRQLRLDNARLQEESQTAAAQLRKFTEWFFNTIDRQ